MKSYFNHLYTSTNSDLQVCPIPYYHTTRAKCKNSHSSLHCCDCSLSYRLPTFAGGDSIYLMLEVDRRVTS